MRKWLWLFILTLAPASYAQINIPAPSYVKTLPSTCGNSGSWVLISTGSYYVCYAGVPKLVGGGGTVSSGGPYAIPGYGAGTSTTVGPTNITTDATGNNLNVPGIVAAGTTTPTTIGSNGVLLNGVPALRSQTSLNNYYSGGSGNLTGTGYDNTANGYQALYSNTTGNYNTANGDLAGRYIADGVTVNQTSTNSVYEGYQAYPLADGDTNEIVTGTAAIGHGSNTATFGNTSITDTYLNGTVHITSTAPTSSLGTVATYSTNTGGEVISLAAATSVTITFANGGWTNAAFCTATPSVTVATGVFNSSQSNTAVTFTFPAITGGLFYHCDGN